ncbi:MAG: hypothetical protein R6X13_11090 [bacterium]
MKTTTIVIVCLLCAVASAQEWIARYSTGPGRVEVPEAVAVNDSGEIFVAGYARGLTLIKYSPAGETMWVRTRPRPDLALDTNGVDVAWLSYGTVLVVGGVRRDSFNGFRLVNFTNSGACQYDTVFWHSKSRDPLIAGKTFLATTDNALYVFGRTLRDTAGVRNDPEAVLCKFLPDPRFIWARFIGYGYGWSDYARGVCVDSRQGIHVAGRANRNPQELAYAAKFDSSGRRLWYSTVGSESLDAEGMAVAGTEAATYLVGLRQLTSSGSKLGFVSRFNTNGGSVWSVTDTSLFDAASLDAAGDIYIAADKGPHAYDRDVVTLKYNSNGQLQWKKTWAFPESVRAYPRRVFLDTSGDVVVSGDVNSRYSQRYMGIRYSPSGTQVWSDTSPEVGQREAIVTDAVLDGQGNLISTGYNITPAYTADWVTMKFHPVGSVAEQGAESVAEREAINVLPAVVRATCRISAPGWDGPLVVADRSGRVVRTLASRPASLAPVPWDLCDGAGRRVADGVYFILAPPRSGLCPARLVVAR